MMPVDLGQYTPDRNDNPIAADGAPTTGFEDLLAQMQSLQFNALANTGVMRSNVSDGSFSGSENVGGADAREARINQETQSARQSEVAKSNTRGADPSSVQNGVVSERHERVLTQKELSTEAKPLPEPKSSSTSTESPRAAELPERSVAGKPELPSGKPAGQQATKADSALQQLTVTDNAASNQRQPTNGESNQQQANPNTQSSKAITVSTAAAAAKVEGNASAKNASPAQRIGQILAGNATAQVTRASGTEAQAQPNRNTSNRAADQSQLAKARADGQTQARGSADGPEQTKRSEFENLVKSIRMNRGAKSSSATIRLNPPELGKMKIQAQMSNDVLRVRVEASSSAARNLLTERSGELLAALHDRGIDVDRFEVAEPESTRTDLQDENTTDREAADQSIESGKNNHEAFDADLPIDGEMVGAVQDSDEHLEDKLKTIESDARLDVLV